MIKEITCNNNSVQTKPSIQFHWSAICSPPLLIGELYISCRYHWRNWIAQLHRCQIDNPHHEATHPSLEYPLDLTTIDRTSVRREEPEQSNEKYLARMNSTDQNLIDFKRWFNWSSNPKIIWYQKLKDKDIIITSLIYHIGRIVTKENKWRYLLFPIDSPNLIQRLNTGR